MKPEKRPFVEDTFQFNGYQVGTHIYGSHKDFGLWGYMRFMSAFFGGCPPGS